MNNKNFSCKRKWFVLSILVFYSVFWLSGCSSRKHNTPPTHPVPVYIDSFTATPTVGYMPLAVDFTVAAHSEATIVSYKWSFIDDQYGNPDFVTTTTSPTAGFTYTQTNNYHVTVRAINSKGTHADKSTLITVNKRTPITLKLTPSTALNGSVPLPVIIQADATPTSGSSIKDYKWDFGDGSGFSLTQTTSKIHVLGYYTYTTIGNYTITVKVTDSLGFFTSATLHVTGEVGIIPLSMYQLDSQGDYVTFHGKYAYLADGTAGVKIFDMSNPASPVLVGRYYNPNARPVYACSILGQYLYCAWQATVYILDVSNPSSPRLIAQVNKPSDYQPFKFADRALATTINGTNYLFVTDGQSGTIDIFRLTNFTQSAFITEITGPPVSGGSIIAPIDDIFITSTTGTNPTYYAYVAATTGGLAIYNVSNPTNPTLLDVGASSKYISNANAVGVWLTDTSYAYVADANNGAIILNITDPANPTLAGIPYPASFDTTFEAGQKIWVTGTTVSPTVYLATTTGLKILSVQPDLSLSLVYSSPLTLNSTAYGVYGGVIGSNTYAFVSQLYGVDTFTTTGTPSHASFYPSGGWGSRVKLTDLPADGFSYTALISNYYQTSSHNTGLYGGGVDIVGYNFTRNMQPVFLSRFTVPTDTHGISITATSPEGIPMTVGAIAGGMYVYLVDLTNPASPVIPPALTNPALNKSWYGDPYSNGYSAASYDKIHFIDSDHFIVGDSSELGGYNVTIPNAFITPTTYTLYGYPNSAVTGKDICFTGNTVFVLGDQAGGINLAVVAYPLTANTILSSQDLGYSSQYASMVCSSNYLYVAGNRSVTTINYSDVYNPYIASVFTTTNFLTSLKIVGSTGFSSFYNGTDNSGGFYVFDMRNPLNINLIGTMDYNILSLNSSFTFYDDDKLYGKDIDVFKGPDGNDYALLVTPNRVITFRIVGAP